EHGLFFGVGGLEVGDEFPLRVLRPQRLTFAFFIVRDNGTGCSKDRLRGAVVLLEPNRADAGKILLERKNVLDVGAAPAVDGLILISDNADVVVRRRQMTNEAV